jgi:2-polyprenyl-3-methyl-5-hydroxy-6-metoxy-1,4-benzoquinol methylase
MGGDGKLSKSDASLVPERLLPGTTTWEQGIMDHRQRYEFAARFCEGRTVLDAACGVGYGSKLLLDHKAASVRGLDVSAEAIAIACRTYAEPQLSFAVDDCEMLSSLKEKVQAIVALECIEHFKSPENFLTRCVEVLSSEGVLVLSTPNVKGLGRPNHGRPVNPFHVHEYARQELIDLLAGYFGEVTLYYQCKSSILELHEDVERFVNYAYATSPLLRLRLWLRRRLQHPGHDPIVRPHVPSDDDFTISAGANDPDRAWVFLAVCTQPRLSREFDTNRVGMPSVK